MAIIDLTMPKMGESIMEATILRWHKQPGDHVDADETVLEIATDKVDSEVPSVVEGEITEILFNENDVVPVGAVIARIQASEEKIPDEDDVSLLLPDDEEEEAKNEAESSQDKDTSPKETELPDENKEQKPAPSGGPRFYSPLVLNIARDEGIGLAELEQIKGTGLEGRVTKNDILKYIADKKAGKTPPEKVKPEDSPEKTEPVEATSAGQVATTTPDFSYGNAEIIEMSRMRRLIAEHMVQSKRISPHVTSFSEADVTNLVNWRERIKKDFEKREGTKLTFTPLFIEAIVKCIKKFPLINSSVGDNKIIIKKDINLGMATALPDGSLIVPVIRQADQLNLVGLARKVNSLAQAARNSKLQPDDTRDGTFTLTNVGTFGSLMGTPIINQPQVAILAVGAIKKRPVVVETEQGDSIAIRHMMYLSLSYDHRIVDGSLGATFLAAVANELEQFDLNREL